MRPGAILESVLYAEDLAAARTFYEGALGLDCFAEEPGRHLFFRCADQMLLIFNPRRTTQKAASGIAVPLHGAFGQGHLCFRARSGEEIDAWRAKLQRAGIAIEAEVEWPRGGRSIYCRDPARNSIEFAEARIWGLPSLRRSLAGDRIVVATHNPGKLTEINDLLRPFAVDAVSAGSLGVIEPEEAETTFAGNARLKAEHSAHATGLPALADDSCLCVDALNGDPGVYSARWAGPARDFALAMRHVNERLLAAGATSPDARKAHFASVLAVAWPDGETLIFEGRVDGRLVWPPRGGNGFGYDPMFMPDGFDLTFGEMEPARKHSMSHRARAFEKLIDALF